jgi:nitrate/nitrite transporter NarK
MTALYVVTFGSFIGFSLALPLSITVIFGDTAHRSMRPTRHLEACQEPERPHRR